MAKNQLYYIGERCNPQLATYYRAYGQLPKNQVKKKEDCAYGTMTLTSYETKDLYEAKLKELSEGGARIS